MEESNVLGQCGSLGSFTGYNKKVSATPYQGMFQTAAVQYTVARIHAVVATRSTVSTYFFNVNVQKKSIVNTADNKTVWCH